MKVVLVMFKDGNRREFAVEGDKVIIGRRTDCHFRIPTKDVSREHCALLVEDDAVKVKDLGSSNGTFVNEKRIAESELDPGDRLRIGPVIFVVQIDGQPSNITPEDTQPAAATNDASDQAASDRDDEETFDLSEADLEMDTDGGADFEIDEDMLEEIMGEDEDDMP